MTLNNDTQCCPEFDPKPWQEKTTVWKNKLFIRETVPQVFHIPIPGTFGKAVSRMWKKIEDSHARPDTNDFIMLATESSSWKGEIYVTTKKEVPGAENVRFSGVYFTKVFDGPYNDVPKWIKAITPDIARMGKSVKKYYFYYTTCPNCAKKYGHNYVVAFAEL
jgi:hypothetical protein